MNELERTPLDGGRRASVRWPVLWAVAAVVLALLTLGIGYTIGRRKGKAGPGAQAEVGKRKVKHWTCSMHPQVQQPGPGKCPLCPMDLIPVYEGAAGGEDHPRRLRMSEAAEALAEIQVARVERRFVQAEVRLVGKIDYDETRLAHVAARFPGRLDRLYIDYTGIRVRAGDHLASIYSPELLAAQEELIQVKRAFEKASSGGSEFMRRSSKATLEAAREKLRLWGLSAEQVESVERSGSPSDHMTIHSPTSGIVIQKHLAKGAYVKTGTRICTLADLSRVWVRLDAYESDLEWVRYGQDVEFRAEAYPGEAFRGTISFIDPVLDERTRTVKLRVIAENRDGRLRPGMFVHATVRPRIAASGPGGPGGRVLMDARLAGKWISPHHPEVVKDEPGTCGVCGVPLVRADELGYVSAEDARAPLVIPVSAPLLTGKRAVVYVKVPDQGPTFEGREVVLGPRAGEHYLVRAGLEEGEEVVARGAFKIDSALQIEAKPSMMSPTGGGAGGHGGHGEHGGSRSTPASAGEHGAHAPARVGKPQTTCPVMGGKIDRKYFADHAGARVYFCCPGCEDEFRKDPEKYLRKLREAGVEPEPASAGDG